MIRILSITKLNIIIQLKKKMQSELFSPNKKVIDANLHSKGWKLPFPFFKRIN